MKMKTQKEKRKKYFFLDKEMSRQNYKEKMIEVAQLLKNFHFKSISNFIIFFNLLSL